MVEEPLRNQSNTESRQSSTKSSSSILDAGAKSDWTSEQEAIELAYAFETGDVELIWMLVVYIADVDVNVSGRWSCEPNPSYDGWVDGEEPGTLTFCRQNCVSSTHSTESAYIPNVSC